ncbi:acryloyl-CoA reductase [Paenibacillus psychroresistens]|uniref:Acryloyl-CoA reductase n=1 Tax=Paenibacillus psychroresistens TaxID=1778678 RepID=A0A6B8REJ6_9BACL|nr:YhdH/YhfP family quinone oxidoreductase [Paenibacillus psychroresistens]QGQ93975.1 acryloyl-CoA reductase [Paenibacillus psychroresistens]
MYFQALIIDKVENEVLVQSRTLQWNDLPEGELLIKVAYSSMNYKDALACSANGNIVKSYPFVPGVDLAGIIVASGDDRFKEGDEVIVTGYGLGVTHYGGFSEYARLPAEWALKLPKNLTLKEAMIIGTAGFTAALSVYELVENGVGTADGPTLVTGATGGVGSMSVAILAKLGYEVVASSGKPEMIEHLLQLGASRVIMRSELIKDPIRALDKQLWAGAIDCVGGQALASLLPSIQYGGTVAISGMTGGADLSTSVFPFILRGIRLIGIDSVQVKMSKREKVWEKLASDFKPLLFENMAEEITLGQVMDYVPVILAGKSRGRIVVKL